MSQPSSQWQWVLNTTHLPIPHIMQWMVKWKTQYMGNSAHTHRMILTRGWPLTWKTPLTFITSRCLTESRLWVRKEMYFRSKISFRWQYTYFNPCKHPLKTNLLRKKEVKLCDSKICFIATTSVLQNTFCWMMNDCSQIIEIFFMLFTNDLSIKSLGATFNKLSEYFKLTGIKILVDSKTYLTKIYF